MYNAKYDEETGSYYGNDDYMFDPCRINTTWTLEGDTQGRHFYVTSNEFELIEDFIGTYCTAEDLHNISLDWDRGHYLDEDYRGNDVELEVTEGYLMHCDDTYNRCDIDFSDFTVVEQVSDEHKAVLDYYYDIYRIIDTLEEMMADGLTDDAKVEVKRTLGRYYKMLEL